MIAVMDGEGSEIEGAVAALAIDKDLAGKGHGRIMAAKPVETVASGGNAVVR